jgi:hypothetical protein
MTAMLLINDAKIGISHSAWCAMVQECTELVRALRTSSTIQDNCRTKVRCSYLFVFMKQI